jgi:hypothetical protein
MRPEITIRPEVWGPSPDSRTLNTFRHGALVTDGVALETGVAQTAVLVAQLGWIRPDDRGGVDGLWCLKPEKVLNKPERASIAIPM